MKGRTKIAALTAYDYAFARMLDASDVDLILVGDSLGMVVLGYKNTTHVTMSDMLHHVRAVARAAPRCLVVADLPFGSYPDSTTAVANARELVHAGAEAVKAEGGLRIAPQIQAIVEDGIPFLGHIGMLPQHVLNEGGYKVKGRSEDERAHLQRDAKCLEESGAFGFVMELVEPDFARQLTQSSSLPAIGIGSGQECDGQILVTHDLIGLFPWFKPKFVQQQSDAAAMIHQAVQSWMQTFK